MTELWLVYFFFFFFLFLSSFLFLFFSFFLLQEVFHFHLHVAPKTHTKDGVQMKKPHFVQITQEDLANWAIELRTKLWRNKGKGWCLVCKHFCCQRKSWKQWQVESCTHQYKRNKLRRRRKQRKWWESAVTVESSSWSAKPPHLGFHFSRGPQSSFPSSRLHWYLGPWKCFAPGRKVQPSEWRGTWSTLPQTQQG